MASSSASSIQRRFKYDVFLSFSGKDTRKSLVDHLNEALKRQSIHTYKNDERIKKGKRISDELIKSIEDSKFYIIVFSKKYASSSWCLDELVKIMECHKTTQHTAYPVFYDVEPLEIRKQSGAVGKAFAKHKNKKAAGKWREALKEAANLAGWELKNTFDGHEAKFIQKIVEEISLELRSIDSSVDGNLVGIETRINDVVSSLEACGDDVRMVGIKGMGGIGKTTLARAVFDHISFRFEGKSFVENVRENSKNPSLGLKSLQKQVLSDVSNDQSISVSGVHEGKKKMKDMMCRRKVLVILDDVDHLDQLEALAGEPNKWFKRGSVIIITTRDEQVLVAYRVKLIHDVSFLSNDEAICLFSRYAFGREIPHEGYEELSGQVVSYAAGLPLTIKVLGSFLWNKSESEWIEPLERLKTIPLEETQKKLELSYDSLEDEYKEIFLDVACMLKGCLEDSASRALESCGLYARNGLKVLEKKSLITISANGFLGMHDHIEEMGMNIVRLSFPNEPHRHSRLWIDEEIEDILPNDNLGTEATSSITRVKMSRCNEKSLRRGFGKMKNLRCLVVTYSKGYTKGYGDGWVFDEVSQHFPNSLRFLYLRYFPFKCLPKTFQADNLVGLGIFDSNIIQLWEGRERKVLNKLRFLKVRRTYLRTLDLEMTPNLEMLILKSCLEELHMPVECLKLNSFRLDDSKLRTFDLRLTPNLKELYVNDCKDLVVLHMPIRSLKLESIKVYNSKLRIPDLGLTPNLMTLTIDGCDAFVELHLPSICLKLTSISLGFSKLKTFNLEKTPNLKTLSLARCYNLVELHMPVKCLELTSLYLSHSKLKSFDLGLTPNLETLYLVECHDLVEVSTSVECPNLRYLSLIGSKLRILDLGQISNLETLHLSDCRDLVELCMPVDCLNLIFLDLNRSKLRTFNLGLTPNIERLLLEECYDLVELHTPIGCLKNLAYIDISGCSRFENLLFDRLFESFEGGSLSELCMIAESWDTWPLHSYSGLPKFQFKCFYKEHGASSFGNVEKLISVGLCSYPNLDSFSRSICRFRCLRKLILEGSIQEAPNDLDQLGTLEELTLSSTKIEHLPDNICMLKHLKYLDLQSCWLLQKLPVDLGRLECLEKLILTDCILLRHIPNSICNLKRLKHFHLPYCMLIDNLPEELGYLKCLEELNVEGTGISYLPQSIFGLTGLRIFGSRWRLESYGFTSEIQTLSKTFYVTVP